MSEIKCQRCVYKSSSNIVQGGLADVENEGQYIPILDEMTLEFWVHPESLLIIVDNFDLKSGRYERIYFKQGSEGAPWLMGYPSIFIGKHYSELDFKVLTSADYLPKRLEQLKSAWEKKLNPPKKEVKRPKKKVAKRRK